MHDTKRINLKKIFGPDKPDRLLRETYIDTLDR